MEEFNKFIVAYLFKNNCELDVTFRIESNLEYHGHCAFINRKCEKFGQFCLEQKNDNNFVLIEESDDLYQDDLFKNFLKFLYIDDCDITSDNVYDLLKTSIRFSYENLGKKCIDFIVSKELRPETVLNVLWECKKMEDKYPHESNLVRLRVEALDFITNNFEEISNDESFQHINKECVRLIVEHIRFPLTEETKRLWVKWYGSDDDKNKLLEQYFVEFQNKSLQQFFLDLRNFNDLNIYKTTSRVTVDKKLLLSGINVIQDNNGCNLVVKLFTSDDKLLTCGRSSTNLVKFEPPFYLHPKTTYNLLVQNEPSLSATITQSLFNVEFNSDLRTKIDVLYELNSKNCTKDLCSDLNVFYFNIGSIHAESKYEKLMTALRQDNIELGKLHVIILVETWSNYEKKNFCIPNFKLVYELNRLKEKGGGVAIYAHNSVSDIKVVEKSDQGVPLEFILVQLGPIFNNVTIGAFYCRPKTEKLMERLNTIFQKFKNVLMFGDFNVDLLRRADTDGDKLKIRKNFLDLLSKVKLELLNKISGDFYTNTKKSKRTSTGSIIDHVITDCIKYKYRLALFDLHILKSDCHRAIVLSVNFDGTKEFQVKRKYVPIGVRSSIASKSIESAQNSQAVKEPPGLQLCQLNTAVDSTRSDSCRISTVTYLTNLNNVKVNDDQVPSTSTAIIGHSTIKIKRSKRGKNEESSGETTPKKKSRKKPNVQYDESGVKIERVAKNSKKIQDDPSQRKISDFFRK